jgi:hypothetical protein
MTTTARRAHPNSEGQPCATIQEQVSGTATRHRLRSLRYSREIHAQTGFGVSSGSWRFYASITDIVVDDSVGCRLW